MNIDWQKVEMIRIKLERLHPEQRENQIIKDMIYLSDCLKELASAPLTNKTEAGTGSNHTGRSV